jgi:hypothetical protein
MFQYVFKIFVLVGFISLELKAEESLRCNGSLISPPDVYIRVINKCGQPAETIEYTTVTRIHQRYILDSSINKRILFDKFIVTGDFENSSDDDSGELNNDEIHAELARLSEKNHDKKYKYKKLNIQRTIYNLQFINNLNLQYVFWETSIENNIMKKLIYNFGLTRFMRILIFKNGLLWKLESKEYGF